jgi:hypothetical protein
MGFFRINFKGIFSTTIGGWASFIPDHVFRRLLRVKELIFEKNAKSGKKNDLGQTLTPLLAEEGVQGGTARDPPQYDDDRKAVAFFRRAVSTSSGQISFSGRNRPFPNPWCRGQIPINFSDSEGR